MAKRTASPPSLSARRAKRAAWNDLFRKFAHNVSQWAGSVHAFGIALVVVLTWAITGPLFGFSDTWQLVINTGTTIVTFLMVFLIQNTQNRDNRAVQAKLDEVIVHMVGADNKLIVAEDLSDEQLQRLKSHFEKLAQRQRRNNRQPQTPAAGGSQRSGR
jgi:low affinity Fe/Cu permease